MSLWGARRQQQNASLYSVMPWCTPHQLGTIVLAIFVPVGQYPLPLRPDQIVTFMSTRHV
jgi:hypothetical protein